MKYKNDTFWFRYNQTFTLEAPQKFIIAKYDAVGFLVYMKFLELCLQAENRLLIEDILLEFKTNGITEPNDFFNDLYTRNAIIEYKAGYFGNDIIEDAILYQKKKQTKARQVI